jgi:hypothetical protein
VPGYTVVFDKTRQIGVTLSDEGAEKVAKNADHYAALPDESRQHSILTYAPSDMPRVRGPDETVFRSIRYRAFNGNARLA